MANTRENCLGKRRRTKSFWYHIIVHQIYFKIWICWWNLVNIFFSVLFTFHLILSETLSLLSAKLLLCLIGWHFWVCKMYAICKFLMWMLSLGSMFFYFYEVSEITESPKCNPLGLFSSDDYYLCSRMNCYKEITTWLNFLVETIICAFFFFTLF